MFSKMTQFTFYFALILAISVLSFNASFDSEISDMTEVSDINIIDSDNLEAQITNSGNSVSVNFNYQNTATFPTVVTLPVNDVLNSGSTSLYQSKIVSRFTGVSGVYNPVVSFSLLDTFTLQANPGPANNGGSAGWAMFFDLMSGTRDIYVTQMSTASNAVASASFTVEVFTYPGACLIGSSGGPGSSNSGWTSLGSVPVVQGPTSSGISLIFALPPILVTAGDTVGVALKFTGAGPRYYGSGAPPYSFYSDTNLTLKTGDGRSAPFTTGGTFFTSRALTGVIRYVISTTTAINNNNTEIPGGFTLSQNYPNPFNPSTKIQFGIPTSTFAKLTIYDITGKELQILINEKLNAGMYTVDFNAGNNGINYTSGVYFYRLTAGNFSETRKMILIK